MAVRKSDPDRRPNARKMLMRELARLREEAGWSLAQLAEQVRFDRSYLHKLETGARLGDLPTVKALDEVYGTGNLLQLLWTLARQDAFADKYKRFMELEGQANVRYEYNPSTVPGLLQTEEYARELLASGRPEDEHELEEKVSVRISRQDILRQDDPPYYRAILDESVLRRPTTDPAAWRRQLAHLAEQATQPRTTIQGLPLSAGLHDLLGGSLTILWMPNGTSIAYIESSRNGDLYENPVDVEKLKLSFDLLRDMALSPDESLLFLHSLLTEASARDLPD
ncbi:helix-turn-helix domain-containing protein [Streptomyces specialis]|uniref:helix-turn-helix domain-containing protein n=1 Tax=Streptomyces specialis TaxID=498367 RepID=UPI000A608222|nr:helix-turn-helix transcriptional regulator [Streptomyces specialis]